MNPEKYTKAYLGLNEKQKQAVDTIYGPLMVIAGPGTGKTQLLSTRVGHILSQTDFRPFNILCLTYTTSGVAAMKQRLVELIGAAGNDVEVYTFHSFAEKILQRYSRYHEVENFQFIDDIDKKILVRELLEDVEFNTPLKKGVSSVDSSISFVLGAISQIKKEKYNPDELIRGLNDEMKFKRDSDEFIYKKKSGDFNKGDFYQSKWDKYEHKITKSIQAIELYKKYTEIVKTKKLMDYDDMLLNALHFMEHEENLRMDLQEQYQVIMVDEFQDTSGAQLELIHQLCRDNDEPNIMVVGDEDQSIYRFQGANLHNIFDFHKRYLAARSTEEQLERIVVLEKNYRSTPIILEASRVLIENNTERITHLVEGKTIHKILKAEHPQYKKSIESVEIIEVSDKKDEYLPIALEIEKLILAGNSYDSIAALFPTNSQMIEFSKYLLEMNYPFELSKDDNILEDRLVLSYIQIMQFIQDFANRKVLSPEAFGELLLHPWLNISLYDISKFWTEIKELRIKAPLDFLQFLENYDREDKIKETIVTYIDCVKKLNLQTPSRFFHYVLDSFHIKEWALRQDARMDILQKIEVLDQFIRDYAATIEYPKIQDVIIRLEAYQREAIAIPYVKRFQSENCIQLMTYHKSKGLEFDYVFVYKAGRHADRNNEALYVPEDLLSKSMTDDEDKKRNQEEKRRLLYVAMTRAKKKLFLTDTITDETGKTKNKFKGELNPISEAIRKATPDIAAPVISSQYRLTEQDYTRFECLNITRLALQEESLFENDFVQQRLNDFQLSHSTLNTYLECPRKFYMEKMISVPAETSFQMSMGSFYHSLLEIFDKHCLENSEQHSLEQLNEIGNTELYRYKNDMTEIEFKNVQQALKTNLPILYEEYLKENKYAQYELEKDLNMKVGDCVFTGKIDKLVFQDNSIRIIDYKTGKISNAKKNKKLLPYNEEFILDEDATTDEIYGGNYWRQAVLYTMLVKANYPNIAIGDVQYVFIIPEDNKINSFTFTPNLDDEKYMQNLILSSYEKIQNKEFDCCQKVDCPWCSLVAHRQSLNN